MPQKTISQQLEEVFNQASASYLQGVLKTEQDRAELEAICLAATHRQEELTRVYHQEYDKRLAAERQRLYEKAAHFNLNHPVPPGGGHDRAGAIDREAQQQVQSAHNAELQAARDVSQQAFEDLLERAYRRNQTKGVAVAAFLSASDRRSGEDRRRQRYQD